MAHTIRLGEWIRIGQFSLSLSCMLPPVFDKSEFGSLIVVQDYSFEWLSVRGLFVCLSLVCRALSVWILPATWEEYKTVRRDVLVSRYDRKLQQVY